MSNQKMGYEDMTLKQLQSAAGKVMREKHMRTCVFGNEPREWLIDFLKKYGPQEVTKTQ